MGRNSSQNSQERRSGKRRREYEYTLHIPERRSGIERRKSSVRKQNRKSSNHGDALEDDNTKS